MPKEAAKIGASMSIVAIQDMAEALVKASNSTEYASTLKRTK
jgi:chemotaxis response regulator CheB